MPIIRRKIALWTIAAIAIVLVGTLAGGGWYVSEVIEEKVLQCGAPTPPVFDLEVVGLKDGTVTLRTTSLTKNGSDWDKEGIYGVQSERGYAQVGNILDRDGHQVVRKYTPLDGNIKVGDMVTLDHYAFPADPQTTFQIPFDDVSFSSPLGDFPAWRTNGASNTWAILVHGRRADQREGLRILPVLVESGHPTLSITYRNDKGAPADPDCFYRYGQTEWEDLEGAVKYAAESGAEYVILVAFSYGGSIVMSFLGQSPEAHRVRGIILDSPLLDLNPVIDTGTADIGIPNVLLKSGKIIATLRFGTEWNKLNYLCCVESITVPVLLFHGDADDEVSVETSDQLAQLKLDTVQYVRVPGAGHVRAWNTDREGYEGAVKVFLGRLTP